MIFLVHLSLPHISLNDKVRQMFAFMIPVRFGIAIFLLMLSFSYLLHRT